MRKKRKDFNSNAARFELTSLGPQSMRKHSIAMGKAGEATATHQPVEEWVQHDEDSGIVLLIGTPGLSAGHVATSSSYFDRLWKRSQITNRYFFVFEKPIQPIIGTYGVATAKAERSSSGSNSSSLHSGSIGVPSKKHITFDVDDGDDAGHATPVSDTGKCAEKITEEEVFEEEEDYKVVKKKSKK